MTRVWLPDPPEAFGGLPDGIEADVWTGGDDLPDSADQVEFVVLPFGVQPEIVQKIGALPSLKTIQLLSAGADHVLPHIPGHVTLCNARGAHTAGDRRADGRRSSSRACASSPASRSRSGTAAGRTR